MTMRSFQPFSAPATPRLALPLFTGMSLSLDYDTPALSPRLAKRLQGWPLTGPAPRYRELEEISTLLASETEWQALVARQAHLERDCRLLQNYILDEGLHTRKKSKKLHEAERVALDLYERLLSFSVTARRGVIRRRFRIS